MDCMQHYESPLGPITLAGTTDALTGLWFDGQKYYASTASPEATEKDLPVFRETRRWLDLYFAGQRPDFTPPLDLRGTSFQQAVWQILLTIPYGQTISYGQIARMLPNPRTAAQAVGSAVGRNPVSLIVPCHRVVGANGQLTGYAGGLEKKAWLLQMERSSIRLEKTKE